MDLTESKGFQIKIISGDLIRIFRVSDTMDDVVLLNGNVVRPGGYQVTKNMRVSDLIPSAIDLRPKSDMNFALIRRENRSKRRVIVRYVNLSEAIENPGSKADLILKPRDELIVFSLSEKRAQKLEQIVRDLKVQATQNYPPMILEINGHVRYSGTFPLEKNARLLDIMQASGGILQGCDLKYSLITRRNSPGNQITIFPISLELALKNPSSENNPVIHSEDKIYIFNNSKLSRTNLIQKDLKKLHEQTKYGELTQVVFIDGWVKYPGQYPRIPAMRISDLILAAGGLKENTYGIGAEITRYEVIENEYRAAQHLFVDLNKIRKNDKKSDLLLKSYDHLRLNQKPQWEKEAVVELKGEVVFPGKYQLKGG